MIFNKQMFPNFLFTYSICLALFSLFHLKNNSSFFPQRELGSCFHVIWSEAYGPNSLAISSEEENKASLNSFLKYMRGWETFLSSPE